MNLTKNNRSKSLIIVLATLWLTPPVVMAELSPAEIQRANSLQNDFPTPHTKWGKPLARGKVRVLFLVLQNPNINALPLRHAVELIQRFDLEGDAVLTMAGKGKTYAITYQGGSGVYGGKVGEKRLAGLLKRPYDCYVVTGEVMGHLPATSRQTILKHVDQGAGMVLLYKPGKGDKLLLGQFDELKSDKDTFLHGIKVNRYRKGQGRMVSVQEYPPETSWNPYAPTAAQRLFGFGLRRDLLYEVQGRLVLWAARQQPSLQIRFDLGPSDLSRAQLGSRGLRLSWNDPSGTVPHRIRTRIRHEGRKPRVLPDITSGDAAGGTRVFHLPMLPAGSYWLDAIAETDKGITGWTTHPLEITADAGIFAIKLDKESGEPGDLVRGKVEVSGNDLAGSTLRVHAIDRHGRVLARQEFSPVEKQTRFALATDPSMPGFMGIEAVIVKENHSICVGYSDRSYKMIRRKQDRWNFLIWGRLYASQFLEQADDLLAASGVTSRMETSNVPWWYMTRAGMNYTPYCDSGLYRLPDMGPQEPTVNEHGVLDRANGCWNHEPIISGLLRKRLDAERDYKAHGVLAYSMGDEVAVFGSCLHPSCWRVYQDWLQTQYGDIKALNASWGSSFATFEKIRPRVDETSIPWYPKRFQRIPWQLSWANNEYSSLGPTSGSTAWNASWKSYPRYIDRRSFQYWNFANYCRRFRDAARVIDPQARCGVEGSDISLDADIDVIVRNTGWWMPYGGENAATTNEVIRSIAPRDYLYGNFIRDSTFWRSILRGGNTLGRWRIDNMLTPAMRLRPDVKRMVESGRIIFDGLGTLLNGNPGARMIDDGIVMLHSMASVKMAKIGDGPSYGIFRSRDDNGKTRSGTPQDQFHVVNRRSHRAWHRNIRAGGMQFRYTTDGQIRRGEFDASRAKVLVLAQYEVIDPDEEALIRQFVDSGGTVIADVRPGLYGARGKPRQGGVLDDLFGVRHTGSLPVSKQSGHLKGTIGTIRVTLNQRPLFVNPAVKVTTGRALGQAGDTPICIVNKTGRGRAVLLNFTMWSFPKLARHDTSADAVQFFQNLMAAAHVTPPVTLVNAEGGRQRNVEAMRWRTGRGIEVLALLGPVPGSGAEPNGAWDPLPVPFQRGLDAPVPITVKLPRPAHVYEMRTGRHSQGAQETFQTTARAFHATLLVVSDRPLRSPVLLATTDKVDRGRALTFRLLVPRAQGRRVLKIRATAPDGEPAPWFDQPVIVQDGLGELALPIFLEQHRRPAGGQPFDMLADMATVGAQKMAAGELSSSHHQEELPR